MGILDWILGRPKFGEVRVEFFESYETYVHTLKNAILQIEYDVRHKPIDKIVLTRTEEGWTLQRGY